ncbi:4-alpha-glucanotransferase [Modicisalibacter luteus]|uniref:4-alpha-glucanotransferase n=1 Tax=Modicisalibacter luteus TaxID=453962 RepID=A0ABV7M2H9_9GAMM|nr:4-alpha-glucanotransferase [Halomonas lutea]GHB08223.1 4-alpha-glucanotransferase [Halomonas lutea]
MSDDRLRELADAAGLLVEWENSDGELCELSPDTQRILLGVLGFPADDDAAIEASLARLTQWRNPTEPAQWPPLITVDCDVPVTLPGPMPRGTAYVLTLEAGGVQRGEVEEGNRLPPISAMGYHHLQIAGIELIVAAAPKQCFGPADASGQTEPRLWGMAVQLYALRRPGDGGIGDTLALEHFARRAAGQGAATLAISPTHAMFSADPDRYSPYSPSSRLLSNALYGAPEQLLGERAVASATAACGLDDELRRLEADDDLDWPAAGRAKLTWLRRLYDDLLSRDDDEAVKVRRQLDEFRKAGGETLEDHCRFEALQAVRGAGYWRHWPAPLQDPTSPEVARFAEEHAHEVGFHAFLQWQVTQGLAHAQAVAREAGMPIGLIADLAVGADDAGSQSWSRQGEMLEGVSIGAPPDTFNVHGQDWGLAAFSPHGLVRSGFRTFIDMLRASFQHAGGLRIDHILGLMRLWLVPHGASPKEGGYVSYPLDDMLRLVALESWRHRGIVVGEDLGTVAPGFRDKLTERGILGMQVLWFEQDDDGSFLPAKQWSNTAMATTTTHDLPTVAGWWAGRDIDWRSRLDLLGDNQDADSEHQARSEARAHLAGTLDLLGHATPRPSALQASDLSASQVLDACARHIGRTPSPLAILPVEDVLGLEEQANLPGTLDEHPNWRRRWMAEADALLVPDEVRHRLGELQRGRDISRQVASAPLEPKS